MNNDPGAKIPEAFKGTVAAKELEYSERIEKAREHLAKPHPKISADTNGVIPGVLYVI